MKYKRTLNILINTFFAGRHDHLISLAAIFGCRK